MQIRAIKLSVLNPPQDSLFNRIKESRLTLQEGDIVAVSSKVVSIHEGRCVPVRDFSKDELIKEEAQLYVSREAAKSPYGAFFTVTRGVLVGSAGVDESNGNGHYILYPEDPMGSAKKILAWLKKTYKVKKLGLVITDSHSTPLHRGAIGFCIGWAGFDPFYDYRGLRDVFGRPLQFSQANFADALAVASVLVMGEGDEQTPLAVVRDVPEKIFESRHTKKENFSVTLDNDLFAPFFERLPWKKGGNGKKLKK